MRFCDITLSYTETSGGIRTYLDEKRKYLLEHTDHEHILIIPGDEDAVETSGRTRTYTIASPMLPGCAPYRMFWRPDKIKAALIDASPDVVELGSFYISPWAAFSYRKQRELEGSLVTLGAYFHTDIADAYVGTPLRHALAEPLGSWSESLEMLGCKLADMLAGGAENYVRSVFERCDVRMAASSRQAARLGEYGVNEVAVVPLGVDLDLFHPRRRSEEIRSRYGATPADLVLIYGGRLDDEKHVFTLIDAYTHLDKDLSARLLILGEGPRRDELMARAGEIDGVSILPYESDEAAYATLLASADIYVTAGPHETFGLSVVEAQACGLPVVGVNAGALQERVTEGLGYLGPVDDAVAMARNIKRVAEQREDLSRRNRQHVEQQFSWNRTFKTELALYERAVATRVGPVAV